MVSVINTNLCVISAFKIFELKNYVKSAVTWSRGALKRKWKGEANLVLGMGDLVHGEDEIFLTPKWA